MKAKHILIAALCFLIPIAGRTLWYYQGIYQRAAAVAAPDYASLTMPQPDLATPMPDQPAKAQTSASPVVLIDMAHYNLFSLSEIELLEREIEKAGAKVEVNTSSDGLAWKLKYADALVVISPALEFSSSDVRTVSEFVKRGGRLLVATDSTRNFGLATDTAAVVMNSLEIANILLEPHHISFTSDYLYNLTHNEANFRNVIFTKFAVSSLTEGLSKIVLYGAHSIRTGEMPLITADDDTLSSLTDSGGGLAAVMTDQSQQVLALGDVTFMTPPYNQVGDNTRLVQNIAMFLSQAKTQPGLETYPYLFTRPAVIDFVQAVSADVKGADGQDGLDAEAFGAIASVQKYLDGIHVDSTISSQPEKGQDLVLMTTFPPSKAVEEAIKSFKLEFSAKTISSLGGLSTPTATVEPKGTSTPHAGIQLLGTSC